MRALAGFALLVLGIASVVPAQASDLVVPQHSEFAVVGKRAAPLVIYDYQPGVIVRAYWLKPWRNRHYFPTTGTAPGVGRLEDMSAEREMPEPAESFFREWSASSLIDNTRNTYAAPPSRSSDRKDMPPSRINPTDPAPPNGVKP